MSQTYAQLKSKLNDLLDRIQDPEVDLDEALKLHGEAKKTIELLEKYLTDATGKVKKAKSS